MNREAADASSCLHFVRYVLCQVSVTCLLLCLRWRERLNYRRSSDERASVTGDTREIRTLWTRKVKESAGREFRKERRRRKESGPIIVAPELVNREMPGSRGWIPGGLRFSQPIKPSSAGSDVGERELLADNRRHARRIEPGYGRC